ncbi:hypothetical protein SCHPADRAFT_424202 [Schizopora paradoxa]|uniref:Origin recognition complex subunit 5 n=1 Tax=Schizopora paradoxa TaxID=27342 RepID=A0A0H2S5W8_9AGAM|nr:hypothetical protein SCHPADRAFT_424202 [Schizopora paradoxa]
MNDYTTQVADDFCCDEELVQQVISLTTSPTPSFAYVYDAQTPENTRNMLQCVLARSTSACGGMNIAYAFINCVACFSQRLLFDTTLNTLMKHRSTWNNGFGLWEDGALEAGNWNDSLDGFFRGLNSCYAMLLKGGAADDRRPPVSTKIVLVFERPEKLKETLPGIVMPLARLHEMAKANITTIFLGETEWENITPHAGTLPDPHRITVQTLSKEALMRMITKKFPDTYPETSLSPYNPTLKTLFAHFVETVYNVCSPFTVEPKELAYLVAARWPGFVSPLLEDWKHQNSEELQGPSEESRIRLIKLFMPSLSNAVESLYPRLLSAKEWSNTNTPPNGMRLSRAAAKLPQASTTSSVITDELPELPKISNFILLASFLASHNPAKTDARMFGRNMDDKKRKRKKGGSPRKQGGSAKVSQLLQGPMTFPYDRLIAILGALLLEYDDGARQSLSFSGSILNVESEVFRIQTNALIQDLMSKHLLHRTTAPERFDSMQFKCGITQEQGLALARRLGIPLAELMWDPM